MAIKQKGRATINVSTKASITLAKLVIKVRSKGIACYKQGLVNSMIAHLESNTDLLIQLAKETADK